METVASVEGAKAKRVDTRTPAQKAFDRVQSKRVSQAIIAQYTLSVLCLHSTEKYSYDTLLSVCSKQRGFLRRHIRRTRQELRYSDDTVVNLTLLLSRSRSLMRTWTLSQNITIFLKSAGQNR